MPFNSFRSFNTMNFKEMVFFALKRWYVLCVLLLLSGATSLIYTNFLAVPQYRSTGKIYIQDQKRVEKDITSDEITISSTLAYDYTNLLLDRAILDQVAKVMNYKYSYVKLSRSIVVVNPENTRFIEITVQTPNAKDSKKIVDLLIDISQEKVVELLNIDRITVIRRGTVAQQPSEPNVSVHMRISLSVGAVLFLFFVAAVYILDDKVKGPDDVQNGLGLTLLGSISYASGKYSRIKREN